MSDMSHPTTGPNALPSEVLKRIVGGAHHDEKQNVDSNTAIEMTAGAEEAGHAAGGQATEPAGQPPAADGRSTAATERVEDAGKLVNHLQGQLQEQASPKLNEIPKVVTDEQQRDQPALEPSRTMLEAEQPAQDAAQSADEVQHDFSEQAKTVGAVLQHEATQAAHPDFPHDPDAVESGDPDVFKAALADLFGKSATGQAGIANESGIDSGEKARESLEAQQKQAETISTPDAKPPSDDEIADQINRSVGVDQAAELASTWHDDEQVKYKEMIEKLWALARATGDDYLSNQIGHLVTAHNHYLWQLESDQHAKSLAQTASVAKAYLGDISLAREIVEFKTRDVKYAESRLEQAKAAGDADWRRWEGGVSHAKAVLHDAERVLNKWIDKREDVLRMLQREEKAGNAFEVQSLKTVRGQLEKLYLEYTPKPATSQPAWAPVGVKSGSDLAIEETLEHLRIVDEAAREQARMIEERFKPDATVKILAKLGQAITSYDLGAIRSLTDQLDKFTKDTPRE